jgi:uncharacterized protein YbaR (Trm112 family)
MVQDPIDPELFSILACPVCRSDLNYDEKKTKLVCVKCKKVYDINEGIPVLLPK